MTDKKTFYIIDAHAFLHRAYHALPKLTTSKGEEVGALFGFTRFLLKIIKDKKPNAIAVCFDSPGKTFRHEEYEEYKANREEVDDALITQLQLARDIVKTLGLNLIAKEGYEADDIMATLAKRASEKGFKSVLVTSDKDSYQMVDDNVSIWPGNNEPLRGEEYVVQKYGLKPKSLIDYFAIVGDSIDNVPGIRGLGPKNATKLINEFGTLENLIESVKSGRTESLAKLTVQKILDNIDNAILSKRLVTLDTDAKIDFDKDDFSIKTPDKEELAKMANRFEFKDLLKMSQELDRKELPLPPVADWDRLIEKANGAKDIYIQTNGVWTAIGLSPEEFSYKQNDFLTDDDVTKLREIILNPKIPKIGHYFKEAIRNFKMDFSTCEPVNCFDLALGAYCLNPSKSSFGFENLCLEFLEIYLPEDDSSAKSLLGQCHLARKLKAKIEDKLKSDSLFKLFSELETPLLTILLQMEINGISIDKDLLVEVGKKLEKRMEELQMEINEVAKEHVNVNSPKQVGALLFDRLQIPTLRKTKTGFSTGEDVLREIAKEHPIADKIIRYREASKLKSTYIEGLLSVAEGKNDTLHTRFDQTGTATGRLSSLSPNLQNIPIRSEYGQEIRKAFVARKNYKLVSADYSQIDLRVLAHESADKNLIDAFKQNKDIHAQTASEVFSEELSKVTKEMRYSAKAINFGIVYGQTGMGLSKALGISQKEAKKYIDSYFKKYPKVKEWIDSTVSYAKKDGFVKTLSGRVRYFPEFNSGNGALVAAGQRAAVNTVIQGGSADIIKYAMIEISDLLRHEPARMLLQVHDELLFEIPEEDIARLTPKIKQGMEKCVELKVPLSVDVKTGENWQEMEKIKDI
jgi:DNA polymerase I